jgi:threonine-phosphate decarboxylase
VDESYLPFVENAEEISLVSHTGYENLMVLSSMSKIFRIPGLRTGFLSAAPSLVERIMAFYQPWSVNALAQAVIEDIFNHPHRIQPFYRETQRYITAEKQVFLDHLKHVPGIRTFDSAAYFILARLENGMKSGEFCRRIGRHRILIRDCSNFLGLSDQYVRFSLKERPVNQRLAEAIAQAITND